MWFKDDLLIRYPGYLLQRWANILSQTLSINHILPSFYEYISKVNPHANLQLLNQARFRATMETYLFGVPMKVFPEKSV